MPWESLLDGNWFDAIFGPYVALLGEPMVGAVISIFVVLAFWIWAHDMALPAVLLFIFGGFLWTILPGDMISLARTIMLIGVVMAIAEIARRYLTDQ